MIYIDALKEEVEFNVGENAADNDTIIDNSSAGDLWFHVGGGRSSCHVVAVIPDGTNKKNVKAFFTF